MWRRVTPSMRHIDRSIDLSVASLTIDPHPALDLCPDSESGLELGQWSIVMANTKVAVLLCCSQVRGVAKGTQSVVDSSEVDHVRVQTKQGQAYIDTWQRGIG